MDMRSKLHLSLIAVAALSCGGGGTGNKVIDGPYTHYVINSFNLPVNTSQANAWSFNLDGAHDGAPENQLGQMMAALYQQGMPVQDNINVAATEGHLAILLSLRTNDTTFMNDDSVSMQVYIGADHASPAPLFDGTDTFSIKSDAPMDALLEGSLAGGGFLGGPDKMSIQLMFVDAAHPITLNLIGAKLSADMTATGCTNGIIGGAVLKTDVETTIVPAIADMINASIAADPTSDNSQKSLDLFDTNNNGIITTEELLGTSIIQTILNADVDLVIDSTCHTVGDHTECTVDPGNDGIKDSVSLGVGFTCVRANFTSSVETAI